jgi:hypothetical protein
MLEKGTDYRWMAGMDPAFENMWSYSPVDDDEWYYVTYDNKYRLFSRKTMKRKGFKLKYYYQGSLESCLSWIKRKLQK